MGDKRWSTGDGSKRGTWVPWMWAMVVIVLMLFGMFAVMKGLG